MKPLRAFLFAMVAACGIATPAAANVTDLWYNPAQSGWGINLVQQGETAFGTLFVYGPDRQPTWYSASNLRVTSYTAAMLPNFEGTLHRTTGPWFGGPFDPAGVNLERVGTLYIESIANDRLRVTYDVNGRIASSEVLRATLATPQSAGFYHAAVALRESPPGGAPYGTAVFAAEIWFEIEGPSATLRIFDGQGRNCVYTGAYSQSGKFSSMSGNFNCHAFSAYPARSGTFVVEEMEFTAQGITGVLKTEAADRNEKGRFAAARMM